MSVRVALADDQALVRAGLRALLKAQQVEVVFEADDGADLLAKLETQPVDVVLSDIRMPAMDGLEMVRRVRTELHDATTPIILISTLGRPEDIRRGLEAGATAYICKPIVPTEIRIALLEFLAAREQDPPLVR